MGQLLLLLGVLAAFFALIGIAWLAAWKLGMLKPTAKVAEEAGGATSVPYRIREEVLSPGERALLPVLREAATIVAAERKLPVPLVLASVRLAEILEVDGAVSGNRSGWQSAFNKISSKQADFVLCNPATTRPVLIIELDDASHGRQDRKDRDGFVDKACASAGLPILHVRAATGYDARALAREIGAKLTPMR